MTTTLLISLGFNLLLLVAWYFERQYRLLYHEDADWWQKNCERRAKVMEEMQQFERVLARIDADHQPG